LLLLLLLLVCGPLHSSVEPLAPACLQLLSHELIVAAVTG
jgi:hypothetical protein